jgi:hypothetical protein
MKPVPVKVTESFGIALLLSGEHLAQHRKVLS